MASKKASAKTVVAEQSVKTAKTSEIIPAVVASKKAALAPGKAVTAEKSVKTPAKPAAPVVKKVEKATVVTSKVTFSLPKEAVENAEIVAVLGDFNNWQDGVTLKKQKDGSFATAVELEKGRTYEFRFLINGEKWENAWNAEAYKPTPFGAFNSVVTV